MSDMGAGADVRTMLTVGWGSFGLSPQRMNLPMVGLHPEGDWKDVFRAQKT